MWVIRSISKHSDADKLVSSLGDKPTFHVEYARKFSLPADAECWIDSHGGGDRERFRVVELGEAT